MTALAERITEFEAALDADPLDFPTRLVYGDWLEEIGRHDEAFAQRWMAEYKRAPMGNDKRSFLWLTCILNNEDSYNYRLPPNVFFRPPPRGGELVAER